MLSTVRGRFQLSETRKLTSMKNAGASRMASDTVRDAQRVKKASQMSARRCHGSDQPPKEALRESQFRARRREIKSDPCFAWLCRGKHTSQPTSVPAGRAQGLHPPCRKIPAGVFRQPQHPAWHLIPCGMLFYLFGARPVAEGTCRWSAQANNPWTCDKDPQAGSKHPLGCPAAPVHTG